MYVWWMWRGTVAVWWVLICSPHFEKKMNLGFSFIGNKSSSNVRLLEPRDEPLNPKDIKRVEIESVKGEDDNIWFGVFVSTDMLCYIEYHETRKAQMDHIAMIRKAQRGVSQ
jgi:hypothetical protein